MNVSLERHLEYEWSPNSEDDPATLNPLPLVLVNGLTAITVVGFLSFLSTLWPCAYLTYQFVNWHVGGSHTNDNADEAGRRTATELNFNVDGFLVPVSRGSTRQKKALFQRLREEPPNQFFILIYNLLLADAQQSLGFLLSIAWLSKHGIVVESTSCWTQGWFLSTGNLAASFFVCAIGIHTFLGVIQNYRPPTWVFYSGICVLWVLVYVITLVAIPIALYVNPGNEYGLYARAGPWCWINGGYPNLRLYVHYLWIFLCLALTTVVYVVIVITLHIRRNAPSETPHTQSFELPTPTSLPSNSSSKAKGPGHDHSEERLDSDRASISSFLLYPLIYIVCTAPLAICRLLVAADVEVPLSWYCLVGALIASRGWLDVLLYATTRRSIIFSGSKPPGQDTGLRTFAFIRRGSLRTPKREFGNAVFVEGGKARESHGHCGWMRRWWPMGTPHSSSSRPGSLHGHALSTKNRSNENFAGGNRGIALQSFGMEEDGEVFGNAIQCETTTSVTVERAEEKQEPGNTKRESWCNRGVRVVG
ncbi:hypothetical protein QBC38DRAFT_548406 [Podospora fimiseda]|uniref:Glucose receptor Git3 N-terminal domain-containing protein n=1 Tax=Podospora fimiseda TaxID=252190 RepID=A0AAN7BHS7_9PEZI|nr:hypothetical protein QBC38DRAFT_548406 [Podospora fimiseda]